MKLFVGGSGRPFSLRLNLQLLVLLCVLPAMLVSAVLMRDNYRLERQNVQHYSALVAQTVLADLDRDIAGMESALKTLATSPELATGDLRAFHARARQALPSGIVYNYLLTDREGRQVLNTLRPFGSPLPTTGTPEQLAAVFTGRSTVLTDLFIGPVTGLPAIAMGVPVVVDGEVAYSLNIGLAPQRLQELVDRHPLPEGWLMSILDRSGTIVARSRDVGRFLGQKAVPELQTAVAGGRSGSMTTTTKEGIPVFTSYAVSNPWRWSVAVGAPTELLHQGLLENLWQVGLGLLGAVALGLGLGRLLMGRVMASVTGLNQAALQLVKGEQVVLPELQLKEAQDVGHAMERAAEVMQQVKFLAQHDALTRLPNRVLFEDFAARRMALANRQGRQLVVMAVDLDGFKLVNDTYGHAAGDEVLRTAALRLSATVRASDMVARIGGDEFLVLLYDLDLEAAIDTANRMVSALSEPYPRVDVAVSASVGVAVYQGGAETLPALCGRADSALYEAKQGGKKRAALARL